MTNKPTPTYTSLPNRILDLQAEGKLSVYGVSLAIWLARYGRQKNYCFPSVETLRTNMGVSVASVYKGLEELEAIGGVTIGKRNDRAGNHNDYTLHFWKLAEQAAQQKPDRPKADLSSNGGHPEVQHSATQHSKPMPHGGEVYAVEVQAQNHT